MRKNITKKVKDKKVKAFNAVVRTVWGFERVFKSYCHSEESQGLWAYVRHSSQDEKRTANAMQRSEDIVLEMGYSPKITTDLNLEWGGKTYAIVSIDPYEFNKTDLEIRAEEVSPPVFDEEEWQEQ